MTVGTTHNTLTNLCSGLANAFGIADVQGFRAPDVIEMQGHCVRLVSAVYASVLNLVGVKPSPKSRGSLVGFTIYPSSVCGVSKALLSPCFCFGRIVRAVAGLAVCLFHLVRIAFSPTATGISGTDFLFFSFHAPTISGFNGRVK